MHSVLITLTEDDSRLKIGKLADMCKENLPSLDSYLGEHLCWYLKWTKQSDTLGSVALPAKPTQVFRLFTCMITYIKMLLHSLHSTCHCLFFREVTSLKRIKTSIRSRISNERLFGLSLLHHHHDIPIVISKVIDEFARHHPHSMQFTNIRLSISSVIIKFPYC